MAGNVRKNFTYHYYKKYMSRLREAYHFTTFQEGKKSINEACSPLLILRHDIDMELEAALKMALIESELGIHSTLFFMVSCPIYNVFSNNGAK